MFDWIGHLFGSIGGSMAAVLIAVAGFISPAPASVPTQPATTTVASTEEQNLQPQVVSNEGNTVEQDAHQNKIEEQTNAEAIKAAQEKQAKIDAATLAAQQQAAQRAQQQADQEASQLAQQQQDALIAAQQKADSEAAQQRAATSALEAKTASLNAVNLKIANLNAKYAQDMQACESQGDTMSYVYGCQNR